MKIEEAIRYFERELEGTEETEAWLAAQEIDDGVLAPWIYTSVLPPI